MFTGEEFPNADYYRSDLRKLIKQVRELENKVNLKFNEAIKAFLLNHFNTLFADAAYNEDTKTLKLYLNIAADGVHVYHMDNESINVGGDYNG